jgi:hypothetical protein
MRKTIACLTLVGAALALGACGSDDDKTEDYCAKSCAKALEAKCPRDSAEECANGCARVKALGVCKAELDTAFACGANATYVCDSAGSSLPEGCDDQINAAARCLGPLADGGTGGGG